ncbi:MAG TPA: hypothetical protein PKA00_16755 [Saprospiraceae bacterium]|nr:hypothetical protein [Saprospiraceae bacterium]HMQ84568.1 hypothetical protein [Saprospiraceae bacterium]
MSIQPFKRHPAFQLLAAALRREKRMELVLYLALALTGIHLCIFFWPSNFYLCLVGSLVFAGGLYALIRLKQQDHELLHLLDQEPEKIVWVYSVVTHRQPFGIQLFQSGTLYFKLMDGNEISVVLPPSKLKLVSRFLNRLLPHASFGYSPERAALYKRDPALLKIN